MQMKVSRNGSRRIGITTAVSVAALIGVASASTWNEKTILEFSEPVMVPGATLRPGAYVFKLMDLKANRHTVQIFNESESKLVATTQAVPITRTDPKGDVVVKFNPTEVGSPLALKGWFYPGSLYGHEFIYPADQARKIAERTKTIVLSTDSEGSEREKGTIRTFNATGQQSEWHGDEATMREWESWRRNHSSGTVAKESARSSRNQTPHPATNAQPNSEDRKEQRESTAPAVKSDFQGMRVKVDQLEDDPQQYIGKTVSVDAEVQDVHGPRVFTIDEPNWGDLEGEILVYVPSNLAALVRENDRVTVTGTVKPFVRAEVEREWGWLDMARDVEVRLSKKPVLVASRIVGGNNDLAMVIAVSAPTDTNKPVGTTGGAGSLVTDLSSIASGGEDLVGRRVDLENVKVGAMAKDTGFFVNASGNAIFVLPSKPDAATVKANDTVSLNGVVLQMPRAMKDRMNMPSGGNRDIYIYATKITK